MTGSLNLPRIGFLGLARDTFDVALAEQTASTARASLSACGFEIAGGDGDGLLLGADEARAAARRAVADGAQALVAAQLTFADAGAICEVGEESDAPLVLWAFPEPRTGGRLRLNSPCGVNLAAHALGRRGRAFGCLYCEPGELSAEALCAEIERAGRDPSEKDEFGGTESRPLPGADAQKKARRTLDALNGSVFARVGEPPAGFDTCALDEDFLQQVFGARVRHMDLPDLFAAADSVSEEDVNALRDTERHLLAGFDEMDPKATGKTLRMRAALSKAAKDENWAGAAVRCWPEAFTEYGGACCGAMSALGGDGVPCACEADVQGALTARLLQNLAGGPAFLADWVDCAPDGSAAFWHCGLAPAQMAGETPRAALHSNRRMPLLREFALKPGVVTVARVTAARNRPGIAAARAEMLDVPRPFGGTCGILKFRRPAREIFTRVLRAGLEHHFAIVYGDVADECAALAEACGLPFFPLCLSD